VWIWTSGWLILSTSGCNQSLFSGIALLIYLFTLIDLALNLADTKTLTIENGIQNSGLALVLIFNYFEGLGGMSIIAGWWGIWHIVSGLTLAALWKRFRNVPTAIQ